MDNVEYRRCSNCRFFNTLVYEEPCRACAEDSEQGRGDYDNYWEENDSARSTDE